MFERLEARVRRAAAARAARLTDEIAGRLAAELPPGISVEAISGGVRISGRALKRRLALEPALRALIGGFK
jgi:hypothetical protein